MGLKQKEELYEITFLLNNGSQYSVERKAKSPKDAAHHEVCRRWYDPKIYSVVETELTGEYAVKNANVIVKKLTGIRKTIHYYRVDAKKSV